MNFQQQIVQSLIWRGLYFGSLLVMNIFLSRYLEAGNAGWIYYLSNNFSFLLILAGLTIETAVNYYASKKEMDDRQLAWFSLCWTALVAVVVGLGLWFYFKQYASTGDITLADYLFFALCYIGGLQLTNFFTVLFYSKRNFFLPNFLMLILNIGLILIIPKQVGTDDTNTSFIIKAYFGYFLLTGFVLAAAFIIKTKSWNNFTLPKLQAIKLLIRYALVALAANIIFFLVYRVDYWFVNRFCSAEELGNYIQVSKLAQMFLIVPSIISSVVFPHTAGGSKAADMKDNILRIGRIISVLYFVVFIFFVIAGKRVFPFVFGESYQLMYLPFLLLVPGVWALSNLFILSAYFGGKNRVRVNLNGAIVGLLVILIGDIILIPRFGIIAAAIVSTIAYGANFLYAFFHLQKEHTVQLTEYWRFNKDDIKWIKAIIKP